MLTTPVIRCLKKQVDGAEIHFVTKKAFEPVLINNPYIDKLWLFDGDLNKLAAQLKHETPDYIIDLHNNLRSGILRRKLRLISLAFNKLNLEKWLMVNFKINRLPDKHIVDRYLETVQLFDVENDGEGLEYYLSVKDEYLPENIENQIPRKYISLSIGAQHFTKKLPPEKLAELCDKVPAPVIILGGPGDEDSAKEIIRLSAHKNIINCCGKLTLNQSAWIIKNSQLVITHDTGLMHIAAAFRKKILSVWGNTIPEFGMYPYQPHSDSRIYEVKNRSCRPCSKIGFKKCPRKHFKCMKDQDMDAIAGYAIQLYENR